MWNYFIKTTLQTYWISNLKQFSLTYRSIIVMIIEQNLYCHLSRWSTTSFSVLHIVHIYDVLYMYDMWRNLISCEILLKSSSKSHLKLLILSRLFAHIIQKRQVNHSKNKSSSTGWVIDKYPSEMNNLKSFFLSHFIECMTGDYSDSFIHIS
jgi:hypothetical protein